MALDDLATRIAATRLADAGDELTAAARALPRSDPGAAVFGAEGVGRLGDLGHDLHREWLVAIETRAREAAAHGARLSVMAEAVSQAGVGYDEADEAARRRTMGVS
jgi:hypothetical protein